MNEYPNEPYLIDRVFVVTRPPGNELLAPVGTLLTCQGEPAGNGIDLMECLGQRLSIEDYPELYAVFGNTFAEPDLIPDEDGSICLDNDAPTLNQHGGWFTLPNFKTGVPEDIDG